MTVENKRLKKLAKMVAASEKRAERKAKLKATIRRYLLKVPVWNPLCVEYIKTADENSRLNALWAERRYFQESSIVETNLHQEIGYAVEQALKAKRKSCMINLFGKRRRIRIEDIE